MSEKIPWGILRYTNCDHLVEVLDFFFENVRPEYFDRLDEWLLAIRPPSGWRQEVNFNPLLGKSRKLFDYGPVFSEVFLKRRNRPYGASR